MRRFLDHPETEVCQVTVTPQEHSGFKFHVATMKGTSHQSRKLSRLPDGSDIQRGWNRMVELGQFAEGRVVVITYPPHTSNLFQALDVLSFGRLNSPKIYLTKCLWSGRHWSSDQNSQSRWTSCRQHNSESFIDQGCIGALRTRWSILFGR
jgi:hypothetical protein